MSMIFMMRQASDTTVATLLAHPLLIQQFLGGELPPPAKPPGFFARIFGLAKETDSSVPAPSLPTETDLEDGDLDKAWHGLHFLLSGSEWEGDWPAGFLLNGGTEVGAIDVGYGPARAFTSAEVEQIDRFLAPIDEPALRARFDSARMMELGIYPTIWDRDPAEDDTLGYLVEYYAQLKEFVGKTRERGHGMVCYLG